MRTTLEDFVSRSRNIHGNKYDYSKVNYSTTETKVIIICPEHGDFLMRPRAHYQDKRGCPKCDKGEKSGFSTESVWAKDRIKNFYIIEAHGNGEKFIKFGLTVEPIKKRFQKGQFPYDYYVLFTVKIRGGIDDENRFNKKYRSMKYKPLKPFRGDSECVEFGLKNHMLKDANSYFQAIISNS